MINNELNKKLKFISENTTEYIYRCPYCGDSVSNPNKGHLYVSKYSPVFRCAKCGTSGHYSKLLDDLKLDITNVTMPDGTTANVSQLSKKVTYEFKLVKEVKTYLESRLGKVKIDPKVCRIVPVEDLQEIYKQSPFYNQKMVYPEHAVVFSCWNGRKLVCRCFGEDDGKFPRYFNYTLEKGKDCYVLDNKRNPKKFREHKTIVLAEGIFDILNTYYNRNLFPKDSVYAAALTSDLGNAFDIAKYVSGCFNPNVVVLADKDMPDSKYLNDIHGKMNSITIYRNRAGKDFGEETVEPYISYRKEF